MHANSSSIPDFVKSLMPAGESGTEILERERAGSNINVQRLSEFMFGREYLDRKQKVEKQLLAEPIFHKDKNYFEGRVDKFKTALARGKKIRQLQVKHKWTKDDSHVAQALMGEPTPYGLHASMFITTLRDQGTPEQHELFLKRAENYEIIGAYAQTELGHGSNVRGLETTATWNPTNKTFIMHSPSLTASKWWIGSMGRTANHAVVMAQLIVGGKNYGPHPFVVQIRDMKTHKPLPNVHVGDIGPKFGYNTMDNGFLLLNKVEIPHVNMMARYSRVDKETNKYIYPPSSTLVYGTMTWVRSTIVYEAGSVLARSVTIAMRYCAIRKQFQDKDAPSTADESQVLDYTMVQYRLLPLLSACFALHFSGRAMMELYEQNQRRLDAAEAKKTKSASGGGPVPEEVDAGGSDLGADLHATSCGLKALASETALDGLEACRRACGGHGFSSFSGLGSWLVDYAPTFTWEGDRYMLTQQVARYLLKMGRAVVSGKYEKNTTTDILAAHLKRGKKAAPSQVDSDMGIVEAFGRRCAHMTFDALKLREGDKRSWNSLLVDFWRVSTAHSQYLVVKQFQEALGKTQQLDASTQQAMHTMFLLYSYWIMDQQGLEFLASGAVSPDQMRQVRFKHLPGTLAALRPHAIKLVDSWAMSDFQLDSSLGRYDGRAYEDMFYRASASGNNPLNNITYDPYPNSGILTKDEPRPKL